MLTFEIINSSIIEFDVVIEVPANNVIEKINVLNTLPEGLTYARTPGAKIKFEGTDTWIDDVIVDNSTDAQMEKDSPFIPSQINLLLIKSITNPATDSKFELRIPALVYDKSKLISKDITNTLSLSSDLKNYESKDIPIQFVEANLNLYSSMDLYRADDLPLEGNLNFCFQMLNSLVKSDNDWFYEITIPITEELILNYPFKVYIHKPYAPLIFATDYTIRLNINQEVYRIKIPHKNQYKDKSIFIEVPYTLHNSTNNSYPYSIQYECSLELSNTDSTLLLPISYACHQIKMLEPRPNIKLISTRLK